MRRVFADMVYWVALANLKDHWHATAIGASRGIPGVEIVTTEAVLVEFPAHSSGQGRTMRAEAVGHVWSILNDSGMRLLPQSHQSFLDGLDLYQFRPDKGYGLTECISMQSMRDEGLGEVLTRDADFVQDGFSILL